MEISGVRFPVSILVTDQTIDLSGFNPRQKQFYLELLEAMDRFYQTAGKGRVVFGIAGGTGAGKSVTAVLLRELAKQAGLPCAFEVVTIDAYHYPNAFLLSHFIGDGRPLKQVKGRFDTYDVAALVRDLKAFAAGATLALPAYSRKLHDPVPDRIPITAPSTILLVEGLWLLYDQGGWAAVRPLLDRCYFIDSDIQRARDAVLKRHMTGGRTLEDAARHYAEVDGRNSDLVRATRARADQILPPYYSL